MRQYETAEWSVPGKEPKGSWVETDISGIFVYGDHQTKVQGFYAGNGTYKVRFLPEEPGRYRVTITGSCLAKDNIFEEECLPAAKGRHGIVRPDGTHFRHADGTWFYPFGTTVYALTHQEDSLVEQTLETLADAPFNKIRMCVFPKHFPYNTNDPASYAFSRKETAAEESAGYTPENPDQWDVHHPDLHFWERLENHIIRLDKMGIQVDLILFHSYDRWGFSKLPRRDALVYLDYLTRRLSSFPNIWWSMGNEYDIMDYGREDWACLAGFLYDHDPYRHLLSSHQIVLPWDFADPKTTHICLQTSDIREISLQIAKFRKPLVIDELGYEGNLPYNWGNLSARELIRRFWIVTMQGGYATHGETFLHPDDVIWWARGGTLVGEAPARIRFLREIIESVGGPLDFYSIDMTQEQFESWKKYVPPDAGKDNITRLLLAADWKEAKPLLLGEREFAAHCGERAYIKYYDLRCTSIGEMNLPEDRAYNVEVIDTWKMTRTTACANVHGKVTFNLPGIEGIAVLARNVEE